MTTVIVYQPYSPGPKGSLKPGQAIRCRDAAEGPRRAERALTGKSVVGAEVVEAEVDEASGEWGEPKYLVRLGRVPELMD